MVIDGGFSQAYHKETGIAGYTLVYHSRGFQLVQHEPFLSTEDAILRGSDIKSTTQIVEMSTHRMRVADTDIGRELKAQVEDLQLLLTALSQWHFIAFFFGEKSMNIKCLTQNTLIKCVTTNPFMRHK